MLISNEVVPTLDLNFKLFLFAYPVRELDKKNQIDTYTLYIYASYYISDII